MHVYNVSSEAWLIYLVSQNKKNTICIWVPDNFFFKAYYWNIWLYINNQSQYVCSLVLGIVNIGLYNLI